MEGNKEEAQKCASMGAAALKEGNFEKAKRLLDKSQRMFPCTATKTLLEQITKKCENAHTHTNTQAGTHTDGDTHTQAHSGTHRRRAHTQKSDAHTATHGGTRTQSHTHSEPSTQTHTHAHTQADTDIQAPKEYTNEQEAFCKSILNTECYYKVLNVAKDATDEELKKQYKVLALKLHPDKNKAPSAEEAFKLVATSFQCLVNAERRAEYDQFGRKGMSAGRRQHTYSEQEFYSPEDLFQAFFFGSGNLHTRHYVRPTRPAQQPADHRALGILQLLPVLAIVFFSLFSNMTTEQRRTYEFHRSRDHSVMRRSDVSKVPYYVQSDFMTKYPHNTEKLQQLEHRIEVDYFERKCNEEEVSSRQKMYYLRLYGSSKELREEQTRVLPSCEKLKTVRRLSIKT